MPELRDGYDAREIHSLDPAAEGIRTVMWATGYSFDFSLVDLPILD